MLVPAGAICVIETGGHHKDPKTGEEVRNGIRGVLAEGVNINLQSEYQQLVSDSDMGDENVINIINAAGTLARSFTGGHAGFSSRFKQATTQVWKGTSPASFALTIDFRRDPINGSMTGVNAAKNLMPLVRTFCSIPLPMEGYIGDVNLGNLIPPGPSLREGLGTDQFTSFLEANICDVDCIDNTYVREGSGIVTVRLGSMTFSRLIMKSAEPTFNQVVDDSGYPISCRIAFQFTSIWAATNKTIEEW